MGFFEDTGITIPEEFDDVYAEAPVKRQTAELPVGYYTGFIEDFRLHMSPDGRLYLKISFVLMTEGWESFLATKWTRIDTSTPEKMLKVAKKLKTDLLILHYDWKGIRSLGDKRKWAKVRGLVVGFHVTYKKDYAYPNIWLRRAFRMITQEEKEKFRPREELPPNQTRGE